MDAPRTVSLDSGEIIRKIDDIARLCGVSGVQSFIDYMAKIPAAMPAGLMKPEHQEYWRNSIVEQEERIRNQLNPLKNMLAETTQKMLQTIVADFRQFGVEATQLIEQNKPLLEEGD